MVAIGLVSPGRPWPAGSATPRPVQFRAPMPSTRRILQIWLGIAFLLAAIKVPLQARLPLTWNNAMEMAEARSFARFGIWQLRAVPLQNNPPIGRDYDAYIHFPPGTPIVLSLSSAGSATQL
jgi:hypothetical protein